MNEELETREIIFSIIIPTYNSENTIRYALDSVYHQEFDLSLIELLVVDGGSNDSTIRIAEEYDRVRVINNPYKLPEYAKAIGHRYATGHYIVRMDSDEELTYPNQLMDKWIFLESHPDITVLLSNGYLVGKHGICGVSASYMNALGDPFSYFVYALKENRYRTNIRNVVWEDGDNVILQFDKDDALPLADSTTCVYSLDYIRGKYPNTYDTVDFICNTYETLIVDNDGLCGLLKSDYVDHNCASSLHIYLKKLEFRVINNVFHKNESGFSSRDIKRYQIRMYAFVIYCLFFPFPFFDSLRLMFKYSDVRFFLHFFYVYWVLFQIVLSYSLKIMGKVRYNSGYGEK